MTIATDIPPHDAEAERCVLGSILVENAAADVVAGQMNPSDFYALHHRAIYLTMQSMREAGQPIDAVTLRDALSASGELEGAGGAAYLIRLLETVPHSAHADFYAKAVGRLATRRRLIDAGHQIVRRAFDLSSDVEELQAEAEQTLLAAGGGRSDIGNLAVEAGLESTFTRIFERMEKGEEVAGVPSGFQHLDRITTGFHESELIVLAARPAMGKTAFVCNVALNIATWARGRCSEEKGATRISGGPLVFSLEQSRSELIERLLCITGRIDGHRLRRGALDDIEQMALMDAAEDLRSLPVFIDDTPGQTMTRIAATARLASRRMNIGIVVVDYLQLIEAEDRRVPREQHIASCTRRLKMLAKELGVPVIVLAQLNRQVELRDDKRPRLADLRESGAIEQDADQVLFLHRPDAYESEDRPGEVDVIVSKNRSGPVGTAELVWRKSALRFEDKAPSVQIPTY